MKLCVGGKDIHETNFEDFVFETEAPPQGGDGAGAGAGREKVDDPFSALCEADACEDEIEQLEQMLAEQDDDRASSFAESGGGQGGE